MSQSRLIYCRVSKIPIEAMMKDYIRGAGMVTHKKRSNVWVARLYGAHGNVRHHERKLLEELDDALRAQGVVRGFEVFRHRELGVRYGYIDVVTRHADRFTCAVADGFASELALLIGDGWVYGDTAHTWCRTALEPGPKHPQQADGPSV